MIKVSVMYANRPGARFDHEYYRDKHLPLIARRMGAGLQYYAIDKGVGNDASGEPAPYVAMCHLLCGSLDAYRASFDPHAAEISADIAHYTDLTPVIQISEVVVENSAHRP